MQATEREFRDFLPSRNLQFGLVFSDFWIPGEKHTHTHGSRTGQGSCQVSSIRRHSWPLLGPARLQPLRWGRPPCLVTSGDSEDGDHVHTCCLLYTAPDPATSGTTDHLVMPSRPRPPHSQYFLCWTLVHLEEVFKCLFPQNTYLRHSPHTLCETSVILR